MTRLADIRGHERPRAALRAAVTHGRIAHALLFAGPDGVGKRTLALAVAAWLQCERGGDDACGECGACRQVAAGSHPDVHLVTAPAGKKDIGIDRVRALKRFTQLRPLGGKLKVGIIEAADRLTVGAQNALLKTLEEPPEHSLLILVIDNPDALLSTVRSRCQRLQFFPLPATAVSEIVQAAGVDAETAAALAAVAEGSPGRALALREAFMRVRREDLAARLAALGGARYVALMQFAAELGQPESDVGVKLEALLEHYRDDAVRAAGAAAATLDASVRRATLVQQAADTLRRTTPNRPLLLEALLLRLASIA